MPITACRKHWRNYNRDVSSSGRQGSWIPHKNVEALDRLGEEGAALGRWPWQSGRGNGDHCHVQLRRQAVDTSRARRQGVRSADARRILGGRGVSSGPQQPLAGHILG